MLLPLVLTATTARCNTISNTSNYERALLTQAVLPRVKCGASVTGTDIYAGNVFFAPIFYACIYVCLIFCSLDVNTQTSCVFSAGKALRLLHALKALQ